MIRGIGVSPGIAMGKVLVKEKQKINIEKRKVKKTENEICRLKDARMKAKAQIEKLYQNILKNMGKEGAQIFEAHIMILDDWEWFGQVEQKIKEEQVNAEWALKNTADMFIQLFENMDNVYMQERAADIKDVTDRIVKILLGIEITDFPNIQEKVIIVAEDLTPSDMAQMNKEKVMGFITETGGKTSHSAIMARMLGIPAVVGTGAIIGKIKNGDMVVFDGNEGKIFINPEQNIFQTYQKKKSEYELFTKELDKLKGTQSVTKDGIQVKIAANIGTPKDIEEVIKNDGEGVGLYRTEFLYMDREKLPTEEEQFAAYKEVAQRLEGKSVVIRTLDIGGDKELSYLKLPKEMNPFLGYRAIRLCLDKVDIFKTQLRAILRASIYGNIKMMFPMIASLTELRRAKDILKQVKEDLKKEGIKFNENIEVGMMIEVPAAAIMSDVFAREVDFFSIGTNDLIQYIVAADRTNHKISYLYNPFHPAALRLIKQVIDNGHKEGIWVGMCGEAAGDPKCIPILVGMGLDELSMNAVSILTARKIIKNTSQADMKKAVDKILHLATAEEVEKFIDEHVRMNDEQF